MVRELYVNKINEITLNVTQSKIDSIRKKCITKSGCRIYKDGYIGIAGTFGEATKETWKSAEENLKNKIPYKYETCKNSQRTRDLRNGEVSPKEFTDKSEKLLSILREEFPEFIFSNKLKMIETETSLINNEELDYVNLDRYYEIELLVKHNTSISVFDTAILYLGRDFDIEKMIFDAENQLTAFNNEVSIPKVDKLPVIMALNDFGKKIISELSGDKLGTNSSIFSKKLGKEVFSKSFTLYLDRSENNFGLPFFDAEGSTVENDKIELINEGIIKYGYTDKMLSNKYGVKNTAAANAYYDEVPNINQQGLSEVRFTAKSGDKKLQDIIRNKYAIYSVFMEGGDWTNDGNFASPVQMAYLLYDGKVIGRLPEFSVSGNIYEMFGEDYLGQTSDNSYFGSPAMVINMKINH